MPWTDEFEHILKRDEPLAQHCWLRIGAAAEFFAEPTSADELSRLVQRCAAENLPVRLLGGGSNLLIRDAIVPGVVIHLGAPTFMEIRFAGNRLTAGGGTRLSHVISAAVSHGLGGLEDLVGIPGTLGGALHGNSGHHGADIGQWTRRVTVMTRAGETIVRAEEELQFGYLESSLNELVILSAELELQPEDKAGLARRMQKQWIVRRAALPRADENTACLFKDPRGMSAAELIDRAGLKGLSVGGAEVSERNPNYVVAREGATADDVLRLMDAIRDGVAQQLGVELENRVETW